jgi:hypothetical protein
LATFGHEITRSVAAIFVLPPVSIAIVAAATSAASALQLIDLLVQAFDFLLAKLAFAFGFLQGDDDAFQVAQNRFERVANAVDLSAQSAVG